MTFEYPSWSSAVLNPLSICFDQGFGAFNKFPNDCRGSDFLRFSMFHHALAFVAQIGVLVDRDESGHVERVAQVSPFVEMHVFLAQRTKLARQTQEPRPT